MKNRFETLKVFCSLAETLQFKETAIRLSVSPPVITRIIAELEDYLGEALFQRNTRQVRLTDFGEQFLPEAQALLAQSERLFMSSKQRRENEMTGLVRITFPSWRINDMIVAQLLTVLAPYPNLIIDWRDDMSKLDSVSHRIDIGLRIGLQPDESLIIKKIADIGDVIVASPKLIAELGEPTSLDDLAERYPFAGQVNPNTGRAWHFPINANLILKPRRINFLSVDTYSGLQAVLQGKSVGMLSDFLCEPYIKSGELVQLLPETKIQKWQLFLYRPYEIVTPPRVLKVFEILEGILKKEFAR